MNGLCKNMTINESVSTKSLKVDSDLQFHVSTRKESDKNRLMLNRVTDESDAQKQRIKKRELEELNRERELILTGKLKPSESYIKTDKVLQIQEKMQNIEIKSRKISVIKVKKPPTRIKWQYAVHRLHLSPPITVPMFNDEAFESNSEALDIIEEKTLETNVNKRDEREDQVKVLSEDALQFRIENNPVLKSFEHAKDVDDLYRIAELWVNPSYEHSNSC